MGQKRYYNYDSNADSTSENTINAGLHLAGVYVGLDLVVTTDNKLTASVGTGLQPDGVMWVEVDTARDISFAPPAVATTYTVTATHDNRLIFGGVGVVYSATEGELTSVANGVILGWIYHPGGGLPLLQDYVVTAPKVKQATTAAYLGSAMPLELIPDYPQSIVTSTDPDITFTPLEFDVGAFVLCQKMTSSPTAVGLQQAVQVLQVYCNNGLRPQTIDFYFYCSAPPATNLVVEVYGTDLLPVSLLSGSPITGSGSWETKSVRVARTGGTFESGKPYTIRLTYNLDIGREIRLGRIKVGFWPYPTTP